jgi:flagellar biosynthetic protein FliS
MDGYEAYRRTRHENTPTRMIPYEMWSGVVRLCARAREAMEKGDLATRHSLLVRAQEIVLALDQAFDDAKAPTLAPSVHTAYRTILQGLAHANMTNNADLLASVQATAARIAESWRERGTKAGGAVDAAGIE